jgi:hypothetical protein
MAGFTIIPDLESIQSGRASMWPWPSHSFDNPSLSVRTVWSVTESQPFKNLSEPFIGRLKCLFVDNAVVLRSEGEFPQHNGRQESRECTYTRDEHSPRTMCSLQIRIHDFDHFTHSSCSLHAILLVTVVSTYSTSSNIIS